MNTLLNLRQNIEDFDAFYDLLGESHDDLDEVQSKMLNSQLILLLANHIGDLAILREAFALARVQIEQQSSAA